MTWKCVLVGLALILPGTLLSVEARVHEESGADPSSGKFLHRLLDFFKQEDDLSRRLYDISPQEAAAASEKRFDANVGENNNNNNNAQQPPPPPTPPQAQEQHEDGSSSGNNSNGGGGGSGGGGGRPKPPAPAPKGPPSHPPHKTGGGGGQEVNAQDAGPVALAVQQSHADAHQKASGDGSGFLAGSNAMFVMVVAGCTVLAAVGIIGAGVCWYKYNRGAKAVSHVEYPAYGVTGPTKDRLPSPGDRKLAQSAQMYHYQHQKQQMIAMEKANGDMKHDASDDESEEDNVEGDYTVYECPGLAPTGEMEVKNPLFRGDETPSTPANDDGQDQPGDN